MSVAGALLLALTLPITIANLATTPTRANIEAADPFVRLILAFGAGIWPIAILAAATGVYWLRGSKRLPKLVVTWTQPLAIAAAIGVVLPLLLRLIGGSNLPTFFSADQSARPGMPFGLAAVLLDETVVRMLVLPALLVFLRRRMTTTPATAAAVVLSGMVFALLHEVGPAAHVFHGDHFLLRFFLPGCALSAAAVLFGVPIALTGHLVAYVMLCLIFA